MPEKDDIVTDVCKRCVIGGVSVFKWDGRVAQVMRGRNGGGCDRSRPFSIIAILAVVVLTKCRGSTVTSAHVSCCCFLTLTDPLRIQPWSQDRRNQTKSNRESEMSMESRQKKDGQEVASKGHRRDKIENINKKHTDSRNKLEPTA